MSAHALRTDAMEYEIALETTSAVAHAAPWFMALDAPMRKVRASALAPTPKPARRRSISVDGSRNWSSLGPFPERAEFCWRFPAVRARHRLSPASVAIEAYQPT